MGTQIKFSIKKQKDKKTQGISNPACPFKKRLFTIKEVAEYLGRIVWSIRELIWAGKLPSVKAGRRVHLDIIDLDQWIDRNKVKTFL